MFLQSFSFIPFMAYEDLIYEYFFANLAFRLPWKQIKFRGLDKNDMFDNSKNISVKLLSKICSDIALKANFHFSSMEVAIATKPLEQRQWKTYFCRG